MGIRRISEVEVLKVRPRICLFWAAGGGETGVILGEDMLGRKLPQVVH